jgi:tRNA modification GTPase
MVYNVDDTIAAIASAPGGSARGVLRISGPNSLEHLHRCFRPSGSRPDLGRSAQRIEGELLLSEPLGAVACSAYIWPTNRSYTRQPTVEIHTLGCMPVLNATLASLCEAGARLAEPGEFTLRAFLAGRLDLPQAEAVLGVIDAAGQQELDVALKQLAGGLSGTLNDLRDRLLNLCADIEAGLDFVDEDIEFIPADQVVMQLKLVEQALTSSLHQMSSRGQSHREPKIVLRGRPNAGKSTLWNCLVENASALVTEIPGTTRDYLEGEMILEEMRCTLIDTAGIDDALSSEVELESQRVTEDQHREADLTVLCIDGSRELEDWDRKQLAAESAPDVIALTKFDSLAESWSRSTAPHDIPLVKVSSHRGDGLDQLRAQLKAQLVAKMGHESGVVSSTAARCHESLRCAQADVRRAKDLAAARAGDELVAAEIRNALNELGKVVGAVYTEDVLDRIFSRFCIGK